MDLKAYAERAGKARSNLAVKAMAFRVMIACYTCNTESEQAADAMQEAVWDQDMDRFNAIDAEYQKAHGLRMEKLRDSWRNLAEIHAAPKWPSAFSQNSRFSHSHPWEIIFRRT